MIINPQPVRPNTIIVIPDLNDLLEQYNNDHEEVLLLLHGAIYTTANRSVRQSLIQQYNLLVYRLNVKHHFFGYQTFSEWRCNPKYRPVVSIVPDPFMPNLEAL
jgi:hypothetical protein